MRSRPKGKGFLTVSTDDTASEQGPEELGLLTEILHNGRNDGIDALIRIVNDRESCLPAHDSLCILEERTHPKQIFMMFFVIFSYDIRKQLLTSL